MSTVKTNNVQVGQSGTATNNFTLYQPTSPDGTVRLGVGNSGATTSDVLVANSSGNLGIGTSSPGARLNAVVSYVASTIVPSLKLSTVGGYNTGSGTAIDFGQDQGTYSTWVTGRVASPRTGSNWGGSLTFSTNDDSSATALVERARFNSTGAFVLAGGNTSANGVGIAFPATQSASTDANTLDDYEEGSWTPTYTSTGATFTYTGQNGRYIKVGNLVWVSFALQTSNVSGTTTNALYVTGLPFTPLNSPGNYSAIGGPTSNFNAVPTGITESPTGIALYQSGTVSVQTPTTAGLASTTKYLWGSMVYTV